MECPIIFAQNALFFFVGKLTLNYIIFANIVKFTIRNVIIKSSESNLLATKKFVRTRRKFKTMKRQPRYMKKLK